MTEDGGVWHLMRGDEVLASLVVTGGTFPGSTPRVRRAPGFEGVVNGPIGITDLQAPIRFMPRRAFVGWLASILTA